MIFPSSALVKYFLRRLAFPSRGSDITTAGNSREGGREEEKKRGGREGERGDLCARRKKAEEKRASDIREEG